MSKNASEVSSVAIIGGGFSGLAVLLHLVEKSQNPLHIYFIEKTSNLCKGVAFGTESLHHPLNVVANQMGAFANKPDDFYVWLKTHKDLWIHQHASLKNLEISPKSFFPRKVFALYLQDLFQRSLKQAKEKKITVDVIRDEIVDIQKMTSTKFQLASTSGKVLVVDFVVLAVGIPAVKTFSFESAALLNNPHYTHNCWNPHPNSLFKQRQFHNDQEVILIGSGLTAIDTLFELRSIGYQGKLKIISPSGKFPHPHSDVIGNPSLKGYHIPTFENCLSLFKAFRGDWEKLQKAGHDWRQVVDALRPFTQKLWHSMPLSQKEQFMRRLFPIWNRHRHRMTPESYNMVNRLLLEGRLQIIPGRVDKVFEGPDKKLVVQYVSSKTSLLEHIAADDVINCSGPQYARGNEDSSLIKTLLQNKLIQKDDLGLGLKIHSKQAVAGKGDGRIFTLGGLLFGELLETTAVPEIRVQADMIADMILSAHQDKRQKITG